MAYPIVAALLVMLAMVVVATLVGAIILRASISLFNVIVGKSSTLPEPSMGKAMAITFATSIANAAAGFIIGSVLAVEPAVNGARGVNMTAQLISIPVSLIVMAGMITVLLPATFGKSFLVTICYCLISIVIIAVIAGICMLVM